MNNEMNIMNNSCLYVDMNILRENVRSVLDELEDDCCIIPVLKDDAYGLGQLKIAACLAEFDRVKCIAVAHVSEGLSLRAGGITKDILVMGSPLPHQLEAAILTQLTLCVPSLETALMINEAAAALSMQVKVQIKLDIGLHRIGMDVGVELDEFIDGIRGLDNLCFAGVFSHFSHAGNDELCKEQYDRFTAGVKKLENAGINCYPRHISCSASSEFYPEYSLDAVRLGRRLYMDNPDKPRGNIKEICSWRSFVTSVKPRKAGDSLGYGSRFYLEKDAVIATVGVGYGDGLDAKLCDVHAPVLINGVECPLMVCCMDQCMVDVSGLECKVGDEVTFFGYDGKGGYISSQAQSLLIDGNEGCGLTSALSTRVARVYIE